jgi:hypothetical protein
LACDTPLKELWMCARRVPVRWRKRDSSPNPRVQDPRQNGGPAVLPAAISIPKHGYLNCVAFLVPGLLAHFVGLVDTVVDSYKPGGLTRQSTPHILVPITTGFWRLQRFFSWHVGIWFSSISRAGGITGWGSVGAVFSAGSYTPREFGFTCYERPWPIVRRPRSSVANMAFGPSACKRITNPAASATRTTDSEDRPERSGAESSGG